MNPTPELVTKSRFADIAGVRKTAVSNWIKREVIHGDAIVGEGRAAKLNLHVALSQVGLNRDMGQTLGNGSATRTSLEDVPGDLLGYRATIAPQEDAAAPNEPDETGPKEDVQRSDSVEVQYKRARLEQQLRTNRKEAAEEALRQGALMGADDAREQMGRIAASMLQVFEGALPGFSEVLAERFDIPQRDVLHLLRDHFRQLRQDAANKERARAAGVDQTVSAEVGE